MKKKGEPTTLTPQVKTKSTIYIFSKLLKNFVLFLEILVCLGFSSAVDLLLRAEPRPHLRHREAENRRLTQRRRRPAVVVVVVVVIIIMIVVVALRDATFAGV